MRMLHDLYSGAAELEFLIEQDLMALKRHRAAMLEKKDISKIKNISGTLHSLEYDVSRYKKWAEQAAEGLE